MGAVTPTRTMLLRWGCAALVLLYVLFLACYFPWRRHRDNLELEFRFELPDYSAPTMIFPAPSGWVYLNGGKDVQCYHRPEKRGGRGKLVHASPFSSQIMCMALSGDVLYFCSCSYSNNHSTDYFLEALYSPPDSAWRVRIKSEQGVPADVAAGGERVAVLSETGVLAGFSTRAGMREWTLDLLAAPDGGAAAQAGSQAFNYYSGQGITQRLVASQEGTFYALAGAGTVCAVDAQGQQLWSSTLPASNGVTLQLVPRLDQLVVLDDSGGVSVLDCLDGQVVWRKQSQSNSGPLGINGLPCVGEDGSVIMLDSNYAFVRVEPGGKAQTQLTAQYSYSSHLLRLDDGGLLTLAGNQLSVLREDGSQRWRYELGQASLLQSNYASSTALALTGSGIIIAACDNMLYGIRPLKLQLSPAQP